MKIIKEIRACENPVLTLVKIAGGLCNYRKEDETFLSEEWFKNAYVFSGKLALVQRADEKYNLITIDGELLFKEWYLDIGFWNDLSRECQGIFLFDEYVPVQRDDYMWNFGDENGNILSEEWFYNVDNFYGDLAMVQREEDKRWNYLKRDGTLLCKEWYKYLDNITKISIEVCFDDGTWHKVDMEGNVIN